jgi:hypothetical protein
VSEATRESVVVHGAADPAKAPSYWLTRFLVLRLLGIVYFFAFLGLARQAVPLFGERGLTPAPAYLARLAEHFGGRGAGALQIPTLFWLGISDRAIQIGAWAGVAVSLIVVAGYANSILMLVLWALYMSFVHVGQDWYGYGWEIQLLETGFLCVFLVPLLDPRPFPRTPAPAPVLWLLRWLAFRIMLGAGLIKIRGDSCWRDLTCLDFHYETQPIPNPLSRMLHFAPAWTHRAGVLFNHGTELVAPWFSFGPREARHAAGAALLAFQVTLILSGNLSFLNWLTIVPILACFDDSLLRRILPERLVARADRAREVALPTRGQAFAVAGIVATVLVLSIPPVLNLLSPEQAMNTSFDRLELVNTYGAFGSVGRERREIVFEGTSDTAITETTTWKAYEFPCKPGDPDRRPCIVSPYQPRLDWQIWFAAMSTPEQYPWTVHLVDKLLRGDAGALSLLANDPFPGTPPRFVRASYYRYEFARTDDPGGAWWKRERLGDWIPPLSADDPRLLEFLDAYGWR